MQHGLESAGQLGGETPIRNYAWHVLATRSSCGRTRGNRSYSLWFRLRAQPEAGLWYLVQDLRQLVEPLLYGKDQT